MDRDKLIAVLQSLPVGANVVVCTGFGVTNFCSDFTGWVGRVEGDGDVCLALEDTCTTEEEPRIDWVKSVESTMGKGT